MGQNVQRVIGAVAIGFGVLTLISGSSVLFGGEAISAMAGEVVHGILWFNTLSSVVYVLAGLCIFRGGRHARALATGLALALAIAAMGLAAHIATGGAYEGRTVGAMALRLGFWLAIAVWLWRRAADGARPAA